MSKPLRNKEVFITAGPTWVPIDKVRVISNISSGLTGITIARQAVEMGARVTLLLGPVDIAHGPQLIAHSPRPKAQTLKIIRFRYFDELRKIVRGKLAHKKYDILIHVAAVSDYRPVHSFLAKIKSGKRNVVIRLKPTVKIVDEMRCLAKDAFLVMFKLEGGKSRIALINAARRSMHRAKADLIVANNMEDISKKAHKAYILGADETMVTVKTKAELAKKLLEEISKRA